MSAYLRVSDKVPVTLGFFGVLYQSSTRIFGQGKVAGSPLSAAKADRVIFHPRLPARCGWSEEPAHYHKDLICSVAGGMVVSLVTVDAGSGQVCNNHRDALMLGQFR